LHAKARPITAHSDSAPFGAISTAATRDRDEVHSGARRRRGRAAARHRVTTKFGRFSFFKIPPSAPQLAPPPATTTPTVVTLWRQLAAVRPRKGVTVRTDSLQKIQASKKPRGERPATERSRAQVFRWRTTWLNLIENLKPVAPVFLPGY